jgi:hypothetical protein
LQFARSFVRIARALRKRSGRTRSNIIIPDHIRPGFQDNLISGLAMNVVGPHWAKLGLNTLVVVVGFLILAGAVNTSIVGSNGVLNRVTEDGVLPEWFQKPQKRYGSTWRLLSLVAALQVAAIVSSGGDVILLGEAYAFGVVWSLVFKALSMLVLRFTEPERHREYRVPLNVRIGRLELPVGLGLVFLILLAAAMADLMTKTVATISGVAFTATILIAFATTEHYREKQVGETVEGGLHGHEKLDQFDIILAERLTAQALDLHHADCKVVSLGISDDLNALEACLIEIDPSTTDVVVVAFHIGAEAGPYGDPEQAVVILAAPRMTDPPDPPLGHHDSKLMTAVVNRAEVAGKPVKPVVILTDDPQSALLLAVRAVGGKELLIGFSGTEPPDAQLDRLVAIWTKLADGQPPCLTIRLIAEGREERRDISGGTRILHAADDDGEIARTLAGSGSD